MWKISDGYVVSSDSDVEPVTASDELGREILSYVPRSLVPAFLMDAGQWTVGLLTCFLCFLRN